LAFRQGGAKKKIKKQILYGIRIRKIHINDSDREEEEGRGKRREKHLNEYYKQLKKIRGVDL
jgi:hypothetical protein